MVVGIRFTVTGTIALTRRRVAVRRAQDGGTELRDKGEGGRPRRILTH